MSRDVRILVVDDDPDTCANLTDLLGDSGYEVDIACHGEAALQLARSFAYHLALLDLRLPQISGVDLYHSLRRERDRMPAMLITGHVSIETREEARLAGFDEIFEKPLDYSRLLPCIQRVIARHNLAP